MRLLVGQFWGRGAMARSSWQLPRKWKFLAAGMQVKGHNMRRACWRPWHPSVPVTANGSLSFLQPALVRNHGHGCHHPLGAPAWLKWFLTLGRWRQVTSRLLSLSWNAPCAFYTRRQAFCIWTQGLPTFFGALNWIVWRCATLGWRLKGGSQQVVFWSLRRVLSSMSRYRPPELWQLDGRIASLQKALFKSFGGSLEFWMRGVWSRLRCCLDAANEGQQLSKQDHSKLVQELAQLTLGRPRQGQT